MMSNSKSNGYVSGSKKRRREESLEYGRECRLPLQIFDGTKIYRNSLNPNELFSDDHVTIHNLIPPGCDSAVIATFEWPSDDFISNVFASTQVKDLYILRHDKRSRDNGRRDCGNAQITQISISNANPRGRNWNYVTCAPHTGGCLHAKFLLFRCGDQGLRVVVSGNNFMEQWNFDRDALWIQDFERKQQERRSQPTPNAASAAATKLDLGSSSSSSFEARLLQVLKRMTACDNQVHHQAVSKFIKSIFRDIDFSGANARIVYSFPSPKDIAADKGGWKQLCQTVKNLRNDLLQQADQYDNTSDEDESKGSTKNNVPILYSMSGSMGDVRPDFLMHLYQAMQGIEVTRIDKETKWDKIVGKVRCLWPSACTAQSMNIDSLVTSTRAMDINHWNRIDDDCRRRIFYDAIPNPQEKGLRQIGCHAVTHAKVMYINVPGPSKDRNDFHVAYVGSHNFSKSAWGIRGVMPRNIEVGVVLASISPHVGKQWRDSFPCLLPKKQDISPKDYAPVSVPPNVMALYEEGSFEEGRNLFRAILMSRAGSSERISPPQTSVTDKKEEIIDLCSDTD